MGKREQDEELVTLLASSQARLFGFILKLTADRQTAEDVLQATNLVIWRRAADYRSGSNFLGWAFQIARTQVLSHRQKVARDKLVFSEDFVEDLAHTLMGFARTEELGDRHEMLLQCQDELPASRRELLWMRYRDGLPLNAISKVTGRTLDATKQMLRRIRQLLMKCIERKTLENMAQ